MKVGISFMCMLGVTANKEILRLLTEYTFDSRLITSVIKSLWDSRPHQDVRACLVSTILRLMGKVHSQDEQTVLWKILDEAAEDTYLPVIQSLFAVDLFQTLVSRIQCRILEHPTSLQARLWAWTNIDHKYCDRQQLVDKAVRLCAQFDREANTLWKAAFTLVVSICAQQQT